MYFTIQCELLQSLGAQFFCKIFSCISIMLYTRNEKDKILISRYFIFTFVIQSKSTFMWSSYSVSTCLPQNRFLGFDTRTGTLLLHMSSLLQARGLHAASEVQQRGGRGAAQSTHGSPQSHRNSYTPTPHITPPPLPTSTS